jgi:hypothetical protein
VVKGSIKAKEEVEMTLESLENTDSIETKSGGE